MVPLDLLTGFGLLAAIEWSKLVEGLKGEFESGVALVLPIAGAILAAFVVFRAVKRFVK